MTLTKFLLASCVFALMACTETATRSSQSRILLMGDSLLATNTLSGHSVAQIAETALREEIIDRSVRGAGFLYSLPISGGLGLNVSKQFQPGSWDWVILNGGGNDLWLGCGCQRCETTLSTLISPQSTSGEIPTLVNRLRSQRIRVVYVGYLRSPGVPSPLDHCHDEGNELERRIEAMADRDPGVYFIPLSDLVPHGDQTFHSRDLIHPSVKASSAIGRRIATLIRNQES